MADENQLTKEALAVAADGAEAGVDSAPDAVDPVDWSQPSNLWQVPTILLCAGLIGLALVFARSRAPENDFVGTLDQVQQQIEEGMMEAARLHLREVIEPNLDLATQPQRGRFKALVADWLYLGEFRDDLRNPDVNRSISEHYASARDLGVLLDSARLERWALAALQLGDTTLVEARLTELEAMSLADGADPQVGQRRNRVMRALVESSLRRPDLPYSSMLARLIEYRDDPLLAPADELWVVLALARLRLEAGHAVEAVDHLLVDTRRLEQRFGVDAAIDFAELYTMLGRGYVQLGQETHARYHLQRALERFDGPEASRGDVLVLLGHLSVQGSDLEAAFVYYDEAASEYVGADCYLPALLGRAEVSGLLTETPRSLEDYRALQRLLVDAPPRRDISIDRVSRSLLERYEAALARRDPELALAHLEIAEQLFEPGAVPQEVLKGLAATHRQMASDLIKQAGGEQDPMGWDAIDPGIRAAASDHYLQAGAASVALVRALVGRPGAEKDWADALWIAADSHDLAGDPEMAVKLMAEYVLGRPAGDPRRADAMARLGRVHLAQGRADEAAAVLTRLLEEHPNSTFATASYVPLARALVGMERRLEAVQLLNGILAGDAVLSGPDALEYADALVELGMIHEEADEFARAIERLQEALERYPDRKDVEHIRFRLALSHLGLANTLRDQQEQPSLAPAEAHALEQRRREALQESMDLFGTVSDNLSGRPSQRLTFLEREMLRDGQRYRADCAYALGEFARAIDLYESLARAYRDHHVSMNAMVQIVNCYDALGDVERREAAHRRAMTRLQQIPDAAFATPGAVMDRVAWEQWLNTRPPADPRGFAGKGST